MDPIVCAIPTLTVSTIKLCFYGCSVQETDLTTEKSLPIEDPSNLLF